MACFSLCQYKPSNEELLNLVKTRGLAPVPTPRDNDSLPESAPIISRPVLEEERARLQEAFNKYDVDGNGNLDLKELKQMITTLGGTMSDADADEAVKALDANGDGTIQFEEFVAFWSQKPGLGGHHLAALGFLRAKLLAQTQMNNALGKIADYTNNSNGTTVDKSTVSGKASFEISQVGSACPSAMGATLSVGKAAKITTWEVHIGLLAVEGKVEALSAGIRSLIDLFANLAPDLKQLCSLTTEGDVVTLIFTIPPLPRQIEQKLEDLCPVGGGQFMFGSTFEEMVSRPDEPLISSTRGLQFEADLSLTRVLAQIFPTPSIEASLFAAFSSIDYAVKLQYSSHESLGDVFRKLMPAAEDKTQQYVFPMAAASPNYLRAKLEEAFHRAPPTPQDELIHETLRQLVALEASFKGLECMSMTGMWRIEFRNVNPLCLFCFALKPILDGIPK